MELRDATTEDVEGIRAVARSSLTESYGHALDEDLIEGAVDRWYDTDELGDKIADENAIVPVAVDEGEIVGFAESAIVDGRRSIGIIDWIHVDPEFRGEGIGSELLARVETKLREHDVEQIEGRVLAANEAGAGFYESVGYEKADEREVEIGDQVFTERLYAKSVDAESEEVLVESHTSEEGDEVFVAYDESDRGSKAAFYIAYLDRDRTERYGYFCSNCDSLDVVMDTMESVECNTCGNRRKSTRWDSVYL